MKIKEASAKSGLTQRTIRLYQDSGLITPEVYERDGRHFTEYSEKDIERLKMIAELRSSMLSIKQIQDMLDFPERTSEIFREYRNELNTAFKRLDELRHRVNVIDADRIESAECLAGALTGVRNIGLPLYDLTYKARVGYCEDYITDEDRRTAYESWCKKQDLRDKYSFLTDWVYKIHGKQLVKWSLITVSLLLILNIAVYNISMLHTTEPVEWFAEGWAVSSDEPEFSEKVSIHVKGTVTRMLFKDDYFSGRLFIDGFRQYNFANGWPVHNEPPIKILLESDFPNGNLTANESQIFYKKGSIYIDRIIFDEELQSLVTFGFGRNGTTERPTIVCPAKSPEEAREIAESVLTANRRTSVDDRP